jgi:hypothetical protein
LVQEVEQVLRRCCLEARFWSCNLCNMPGNDSKVKFSRLVE